MKRFADHSRTDRTFKVGEQVYLKLQPYRQNSVALRKNLKLVAKYYGPFEVLEKIGPVAYRIKLSEAPKSIQFFMCHYSRRMSRGSYKQLIVEKCEDFLVATVVTSIVSGGHDGGSRCRWVLNPNTNVLPTQLPNGSFPIYPLAILNKRTIKRAGTHIYQVLIQWNHSTPQEATWEDYYTIWKKYPAFLGVKKKLRGGECHENNQEQQTMRQALEA
ncbi:hypothetical protein LIER_05334 [Lithospermum erythrorhizon]|uniref:Tf2-1-like SH3-like domain-containing protein n=1 Tax=Lithospermum erythrorhizon TaxID=34254 RepID=A0AAV3P4Y9_LITER